jgi:uncharacterized membrane protein
MAESRESTASARPGRTSAAASTELVEANVKRIAGLEAAEHAKATPGERVADAIAAFTGSMRFVWISVVLVGGWVMLNLVLPTAERIDPFPFPLLTLILSVEAIFLSIFILMSQNRAATVSEKRSHLDLQLNLLSEQENTKMLLMLQEIGQAIGADFSDPELKELEVKTKPEELSQQIDEAADAEKKPGADK